jgi:hypothetical protein
VQPVHSQMQMLIGSQLSCRIHIDWCVVQSAQRVDTKFYFTIYNFNTVNLADIYTTSLYILIPSMQRKMKETNSPLVKVIIL